MGSKDYRHGEIPAKKEISNRMSLGGFTYSLGAYPEGEFSQQVGYDSKYLREEGCFHYHIILPHERLMGAFLSLCGILPDKAHLVAKIHSGDYYRDHDTYISESLIPREEMVEWIQNWRDVVLDDGFFGIGMFAEGETAEVFLDEHKTIQIYHHDPDFIEGVLERMGVPFVFNLRFYFDEAHYHEPLPLEGDHGSDFLTAFEDLADRHELYLDEDDEENTDEDGSPIGMTCWKIEIRGYAPGSVKGRKAAKGFYSTVYLNAESRKEALDLVEEYIGMKAEEVDLFLQAARVPAELLTTDLSRNNLNPDEPGVWFESDRIVFDWNHPS